jgi:putative transposase
MHNPFRYFTSSPEVIRYPLSLRQVEDLLFGRGSISVRRQCGSGRTGRPAVRRGDPQAACSEPVVFPLELAPGQGVRPDQWQDALSLRAVDREGEVLEVLANKRRDRRAALEFLKRALKRYGRLGTLAIAPSLRRNG